jgi:aminopeptidase
MYTVNPELLTKYAKVMVNFALNGGTGIKPGETVWLTGPESAKDLFVEISKQIWLSGGNVISRYMPDNTERYGLNRFLLENGTDEQLSFFPEAYWKGVTESVDHLMFILAYPDIHHLQGVSAEKIAKLNAAMAPWMKMRSEKEAKGNLFWTLCLYGTESMANEAGMTIDEYWEQIINACYLRDEDPIASWKKLQAELELARNTLTSMNIKKVHVTGDDVDLHITIGEQRQWLAGRGMNIPSFEVFTSPDWRGTNGWIKFNQSLYYSGTRISGIFLKFENGVVVESSSTENQEVLKQMIANENADKVGEFSLTDSRHSRITRFMANTLYDENIGGPQGNTHIALGNSYREGYHGDISNISEEQWVELGFNNCPRVHTDMISTTQRKVVATLENDEEVVIYENGKFSFID